VTDFVVTWRLADGSLWRDTSVWDNSAYAHDSAKARLAGCLSLIGPVRGPLFSEGWERSSWTLRATAIDAYEVSAVQS
jgi:hypothetical protein